VHYPLAPTIPLQPHQPSCYSLASHHATASPATASATSVTVSGNGGLVLCSKLACRAGGMVTITAFGGLPALATNKSYKFAQQGPEGVGGGGQVLCQHTTVLHCTVCESTCGAASHLLLQMQPLLLLLHREHLLLHQAHESTCRLGHGDHTADMMHSV
jgi:hypothetical protein